MMSRDGLDFITETVDSVSADGTIIPVRVTRLKVMNKDGTHPVIIDAYGGFQHPAGFYPAFSPTGYEFLKRGGILAGAALRGGNEFGPDWHKAAALSNKEKTLDDLIGAADHLAQIGYTQSKKIILRGTSNGGFVVAAAGLRSPKSFGLIVGFNGVQDMLNKEIYDPRFGFGWSYEYGDSRLPDVRNYLAKISPVTVADTAQSAPHFLIMIGENDSRVNPFHSYRLGATLFANQNLAPGQVQISTVKNSGHWHQAPAYQNAIGWRVQTVMWTTIYDFVGWQL